MFIEVFVGEERVKLGEKYLLYKFYNKEKVSQQPSFQKSSSWVASLCNLLKNRWKRWYSWIGVGHIFCGHWSWAGTMGRWVCRGTVYWVRERYLGVAWRRHVSRVPESKFKCLWSRKLVLFSFLSKNKIEKL